MRLMAKSKIIKQLAKGEIELETALRELRVLLMDFGRPEILDWVNCELEGYPHTDDENANLPDYRIAPGVLKGSYTIGNKIVKNISIPLMPNAPDSLMRFVSEIPFYEGISSLRLMIGNNADTMSPIAMRLSGQHNLLLQTNAAIHMDGLLESYVEVSRVSVQKVIESVSNKTMDILSFIEREFGVLDELDIEVDTKTDDQKETIVNNIYLIMYDARKNIVIGDNNKVRGLDISQT